MLGNVMVDNNDKPDKLSHPHDSVVRKVFGDIHHAKGELLSVLPDKLVTAIDWDTLAVLPTTTISPVLHKRDTDFLYKCSQRGHPTCEFILDSLPAVLDEDLRRRPLTELGKLVLAALKHSGANDLSSMFSTLERGHPRFRRESQYTAGPQNDFAVYSTCESANHTRVHLVRWHHLVLDGCEGESQTSFLACLASNSLKTFTTYELSWEYDYDVKKYEVRLQLLSIVESASPNSNCTPRRITTTVSTTFDSRES